MGTLEGQSQRSRCGHGSRSSHREKMEEAKPLALKMEESPQAKECGQPLAAGKGKDTEPSPKGTQPCWHLISAQ